MPHHIGTDIIEIARIGKALERWDGRFLSRVYTEAERDSYGHRVPQLAACFASKEAVMKMLGTGNRGVGWREIETLHHPSGKPWIRLSGRAKKVAETLGIREIDVSLAHSRDYAIATVIGVT
ncbi:MAG: holo-ACP synthase [Dehalococcoidales bacterium]|nr:holo-ACP synthase [Dehalococcoidales bacterium]